MSAQSKAWGRKTLPCRRSANRYRIMYLPVGTELNQRYRIDGVLGHGGFGITYLASDNLLNIKVAIKEYLPRQMSTRGEGKTLVSVFTGEARENYFHGLKKFLQEAQSIAQFSQHPSIVSCRDYFEANNTAYLVMDYLQGVTLKHYLEQQGGRIPFALALSLMNPVMEALREIHAAGLLHRDISPDNIFLTVVNQVKVLDFGAARQFAGEQSKSLSVILKSGYAPEEQYRSSGRQGTWTDVYACAATIYRAITGQTPPDALDRLAEDTLLPPSRLGAEIPAAAEQALLKALAVEAGQRIQTVAKLAQALQGGEFQTEHIQHPSGGLDAPELPRGSGAGISKGLTRAPSVSSSLSDSFSPSAPTSSYHQGRSRSRWSAIVAGLMGVLILGGGLIWWQGGRDAPRQTVAPAQEATGPPSVISQTAPPPREAAVATPLSQPEQEGWSRMQAGQQSQVPETAPTPESLWQFQVGSRWQLDWQSLYQYHGMLWVKQQLTPNQFLTRITVNFANEKNVKATVSMDGVLTVQGKNVVISCSNPSASWWDTDDFYLEWHNDTMTGYNIDKKGRRGYAVFRFRGQADPTVANHPPSTLSPQDSSHRLPSEPVTSQSRVGESGPRWPWTSSHPLSEDDLRALSLQELELMRNEIYARHGWVFNRQDLQAYFGQQAWYRPRGNIANREQINRLIEAELTPTEKTNVQILLLREKGLKR